MIDAATRCLVRERAGGRCAYRGIFQAHMSFPAFHIDHSIPKQHGGNEEPSNLALACYHGHLHKGSNLTGIDPETGEIVPLFHPPRDVRIIHFALREPMLVR